MVTASRREMRGRALDDDCKKAEVSKNEYGRNDNRCFCLGLVDKMTDEHLLKCTMCLAFAVNATPPN